MIKINTVTIPTPSTFAVGVMDIVKAERNANAEMIIEKIATKRKLELAWNYLSSADLAALLQKITDTFFTVEYPDPQTGAMRSATFYVGDRNCGMIDFLNSTPRYRDIKFNFVEK